MGSGSSEERRWDDADEPVQVWPYDPEWPARFDDERHLLQQALGEFVTGGIHHVGSTAVPGLDSKPIIDIMAGVRDLGSTRPCIGRRDRGMDNAGRRQEPRARLLAHHFIQMSPGAW